MNHRPNIALYEPDIPQNTAAIIRTCACLGAKLEIIEPCGFHLSDKRFKRVVMDYMDWDKIAIHQSADKFFEAKKNRRIILMTTKASVSLSLCAHKTRRDGAQYRPDQLFVRQHQCRLWSTNASLCRCVPPVLQDVRLCIPF